VKEKEEIEREFELQICFRVPPISQFSDLQENELFVNDVTSVVERE
jgi:hypothetical protein